MGHHFRGDDCELFRQQCLDLSRPPSSWAPPGDRSGDFLCRVFGGRGHQCTYRRISALCRFVPLRGRSLRTHHRGGVELRRNINHYLAPGTRAESFGSGPVRGCSERSENMRNAEVQSDLITGPESERKPGGASMWGSIQQKWNRSPLSKKISTRFL